MSNSNNDGECALTTASCWTCDRNGERRFVRTCTSRRPTTHTPTYYSDSCDDISSSSNDRRKKVTLLYTRWR